MAIAFRHPSDGVHPVYRRRALIAITNADEREMYTAILRSSGGFHTTAIEDPHIALNRLQNLRPDLLVIDVPFDPSAAVALCELMCQRSGYPRLIVVILSDSETGVLAERFSKAGADLIVVEPHDPRRCAIALLHSSGNRSGACGSC